MTYKNVALNLSVLAAIGFAIWATFLSYRVEETTPKTTPSLPDAFMENVHAVIMDEEGKLKMKIIAPKMIHYPEGDTTHLTSPQLTLFRNSPIPWFVTAKFAKATSGADNVDFWEDVVIHHPADKKNPATLIKTTTLTVHTDKQTAETKALITMVQPSFIVQAVGMFADMDSGNINLLSQARGQYVPPS